jgi:hypothetical protein
MEGITNSNGTGSIILNKRLIIGISSSVCVAYAIFYYWNTKIKNRVLNFCNSKGSKFKASNSQDSTTCAKGSIPKKLDKERLSRFNLKKQPISQEKKSSLIENKNVNAVKKLFDERAANKLAEVTRSNDLRRLSSSFTLSSSDNQPIFRLNHLIDFLEKEENILENNEKALKYQNELEVTTSELVEKFKIFKKPDMAKVFFRLSGFKLGKKLLEINNIFSIINENYSNTNLDLFDNYKYDNKIGELDTEILLILLKTLNNLTSNQAECKISLKNFLENDTNSNECLAKLLIFFLIEFEKNKKNNLKRFKKIEQIKYFCLSILNNCLAYLKETSTTQIKECRFLHAILFESEPVLFQYDESKASTRNSLKNEEITLKKETAVTYLRLIENILKLYLISGIEIKNAEVSTNNFISFILSEQLYDRLKDLCLVKLDETQVLYESIVGLIIEIKQKDTILFEYEPLDNSVNTCSNDNF